MIGFKEYLNENLVKYKGSFNWHNEIHNLYSQASSESRAFTNFCNQLAKKLKRDYREIFLYFKNKNNYKIKKVD